MNRSLAASRSLVRRIIGVQLQPLTLSVRQIHILRPAFHPTASAEGFPSLPVLPHSAHSLLPPPSIAAAYTRVTYYGSGEHVRSSRIEDKVPVMSPGDKVKEAFREADASSDVVVSDYWGITPTQVLREDGTPWPWKSFRPWDAYKPDISIDLKRHLKPDNFIDKIAFWTIKMLRLPTDLFFQEKLKKRYGCRAMMLETVAAVPGMVAGMLLHCKSLRRFEQSGGWIRALLEEAENERMHLMTFMEVAKPRWYERALVFAVQGGFFNVYFLLYLFSPRLCHRMTGYLEEEAIYSYTEFLKEIDKGNIANVPAPAIAIDYWQLAKDAMLKDVVMVVRADEAHHRDVNHFAADIHEEGKLLKDIPAPLGYH